MGGFGIWEYVEASGNMYNTITATMDLAKQTDWASKVGQDLGQKNWRENCAKNGAVLNFFYIYRIIHVGVKKKTIK